MKARRRLIDSLLITLTIISASPSTSGEYGEAADHIRRAVLEVEEVKKTRKFVERKALGVVEEYTGLDKEDAAYFIWALPIAQQRLSTKPFKNLRVKGKEWTIRPELEYSWKDQGSFNGMVIFNYRWN